jgi:hypothetical protein
MNVAKTSSDLTEAVRARIKPKNFALSAKQSDTGKPAYPIEDRRHAANALARVKQHGDSGERAEVYRDVAKKYPEMASHSDVPEVKAKVASMRFQVALTKQGFAMPAGITDLASKAMTMAKANPTAALGLAGAGVGAAGGAIAGGPGNRLGGALKGGVMGGAAGAAGGYAAPKMMQNMKSVAEGGAGMGFGQSAKSVGQQGWQGVKGMFGGGAAKPAALAPGAGDMTEDALRNKFGAALKLI